MKSLEDVTTDNLIKIAAIDEVAIVAAPGATTKEHHAVLMEHCSNLGDRFAILDGNERINKSTESLADGVCASGRSETGQYAAVYFPWIQVANPLVKGTTRTIPLVVILQECMPVPMPSVVFIKYLLMRLFWVHWIWSIV